ncbi:hypothetical protein VDGD_07542 [Verticillium dahliae]|nr:hypothetical protein VDGD_07542 [Verticillium dahliae]
MPPIDNEINGKLALVTGASGGIGKACATDLWSQGAHLALTYTTNLASVTGLVAALRAASPDRPASHVSVHALDLASQASIEALFAALSAHHGRPAPDILVSNAGTAGFGNRANPRLEAISLDEFDYTIAINLRAAFLLAKLTVPHMKARRWGRIVYVSSISAIGGGINGCHYAASKAGLTGLMKNLAAKHANDGITVNDVAPAMIGDTGMIPDEKRVEGTPGDVKNIPVGRLGTPQECANVVTMLCRTGYMTGQSILLSGGLK